MSAARDTPSVPDEREEVIVIPSYPHAWWRREEIHEGCLITEAWPRGDGRIWRVTSVWDEGASLTLENSRGL